MKKRIRVIFPVIIVLFSLILLFLMLHLEKRKDELSEYIMRKDFIIFDNNFFEEEKSDISYRWISKNAVITLVIPYDQVIKIDFFSWSYKIPREMKVELNDFPLIKLNLSNNRTHYTSPFIYLKRGLYKLKFLISGECQVPALVENSDDTRCLSVGLGDFKKIEALNLATYSDDVGWYGLESYYGKDMRWLGKEGMIRFINLEKGDYFLEFFAFSFYFERKLNIYVDDELVYSLKISLDGVNTKVKLSLKPGLHTIKLEADSCDSPSRLKIGSDIRCLSVAIVKPIIYQLD
jgi:hypothetical protein